LVGQTLSNLSPELTQRLRATWDAVNNRWNQWVLNYSQSNQLNLLQQLGFTSPSWVDLGNLLAGLLSAVGLAGAVWSLWERRQHDPWLRLLQRARRQASRTGLETGPDTTARQLAQRLQARFPHHPDTPAIAAWLLQLEALRYAPHPTPAGRTTLNSLRRAHTALRWPAPAP
jgi:hypothetical protein